MLSRGEKKKKKTAAAGAPPSLLFCPHLEAEVVPARVDLAGPLDGLALDQVDAEAVTEEPGVVFFGERVREEEEGDSVR